LLQQHLTWATKQGWHGPLSSVYFGGGTPSLLSVTTVAGLLGTIREQFGLTADAELTLEANPGTVTEELLAGYREAGVNRLSLGLQSLQPDSLKELGRLHSRDDGLQAIEWARQAGFDNLSLDLMFALPGQTLEVLDDELSTYLDCEPEHLSCYGLSFEPGTPFSARLQTGQLVPPTGDDYAEAYTRIHDRLTGAGFEHYEIANYARPGRACRHNQVYWQRQSYLGVGAGAHSFRAGEWGSRWEIPSDLVSYRQDVLRKQEPARRLEAFDRASAMSEVLYLGLRTTHGVREQAFRQQFGCGVAEAFPQAVADLRPWLCEDAGRWSLTLPGWLLFDRLIQAFL
jgi:oxygen-independent coproporphyrinogen-3 oxidase